MKWRKRHVEEQKYDPLYDPRLDDEGTYDFYACGKPDDKVYWLWSNCKCNECGKDPRFARPIRCQSHYFYCWDGWDCMDDDECWRCVIKNKLYGIKYKVKNRIKKKKEYHKWRNDLKKRLKQSGQWSILTKEQKEHIKKIVKHDF